MYQQQQSSHTVSYAADSTRKHPGVKMGQQPHFVLVMIFLTVLAELVTSQADRLEPPPGRIGNNKKPFLMSILKQH